MVRRLAAQTVVMCGELENYLSGLRCGCGLPPSRSNEKAETSIAAIPDFAARELGCWAQRVEKVVGKGGGHSGRLFPVGYAWATNLTRPPTNVRKWLSVYKAHGRRVYICKRAPAAETPIKCKSPTWCRASSDRSGSGPCPLPQDKRTKLVS